MSEPILPIMPYLELVALLIQIVGLPLAGLGLYLSARNSEQSRNLTVLLTFIESFQTRWEGGWDDMLSQIEAKQAADTPVTLVQEEKLQLAHMLNWIDWIGNLKAKKILKDDGVIVGSLGPALTRILQAGLSTIQADIAKHGVSYWGGIMVIARNLQIKI